MRVVLIGGAFDGASLDVDDGVRRLSITWYDAPQPWGDSGARATHVGIETYRRIDARTFTQTPTQTAMGEELEE